MHRAAPRPVCPSVSDLCRGVQSIPGNSDRRRYMHFPKRPACRLIPPPQGRPRDRGFFLQYRGYIPMPSESNCRCDFSPLKCSAPWPERASAGIFRRMASVPFPYRLWNQSVPTNRVLSSNSNRRQWRGGFRQSFRISFSYNPEVRQLQRLCVCLLRSYREKHG